MPGQDEHFLKGTVQRLLCLEKCNINDSTLVESNKLNSNRIEESSHTQRYAVDAIATLIWEKEERSLYRYSTTSFEDAAFFTTAKTIYVRTFRRPSSIGDLSPLLKEAMGKC